MDFALIVSGVLPVPAVRGGAVECLIDNLIYENEKEGDVKFTVFSPFDKKVNRNDVDKSFTKYIFVKNNCFCEILDLLIYFIAKNILRKKKTMSYRHILRRVHFFKKTGKIISKIDFDGIILENHFTEYIALKEKNNLAKYSGKIFYHSHNEPTFYKRYEREIEHTNTIFSVSKFMDNTNRTFFENNERIRFKVLKNAVDKTKFFKITDSQTLLNIKEKYSVPTNKKIILFAGRITKDKGILEIINAFKLLDDSFLLLIVGDYYFNSKIKSKDSKEIFSELEKIKGKFKFTGFIPYDKMNEIYNVSDIVVLPSVWEDPAPLTVIEALCCGKPLITTNSGGIPEYANEQCAIILEKEKDLTENIAKSISEIIYDSKRLDEMSAEALKASEDLSLPRYYRDYIDILKSGLKK